MPMSCKEYQLDDLMAITAVPVANISAASATSPVNALTPTVASFTPTMTGAIAIGMQPGADIPIMRDTGKAKDDESDSVSGRLHTVSVQCEVDDRDGAVWAPLLTLERSQRHLILTFRGGARAFVAASQDTYICTVERNGAKTSVAFRIQNLMGIQLMV